MTSPILPTPTHRSNAKAHADDWPPALLERVARAMPDDALQSLASTIIWLTESGERNRGDNRLLDIAERRRTAAMRAEWIAEAEAALRP